NASGKRLYLEDVFYFSLVCLPQPLFTLIISSLASDDSVCRAWRKCGSGLFAVTLTCASYQHAVAVFADLMHACHDFLRHGCIIMDLFLHFAQSFQVKVCNAVLTGCREL